MTLTLTGARPARLRRGRREAVEMLEKRFAYFPKRFLWHGHAYSVEAVERCWTMTGARPKLCFHVHCREGSFNLFQDVRLNKWEVSPL